MADMPSRQDILDALQIETSALQNPLAYKESYTIEDFLSPPLLGAFSFPLSSPFLPLYSLFLPLRCSWPDRPGSAGFRRARICSPPPCGGFRFRGRDTYVFFEEGRGEVGRVDLGRGLRCGLWAALWSPPLTSLPASMCVLARPLASCAHSVLIHPGFSSPSPSTSHIPSALRYPFMG